MRILASLLLTLTLFVQAPFVSAQERMIAPFPAPADSIGFLGQDHYYSVVFRGNGESVVTLKAIFANSGVEPLTSLQFRIPKIDPQDVVAYQVQRDPQCVRWNPYPIPTPLPYLQGQGTSGSTGSAPTEIWRDPSCAQYAEPNYYEYYYGNSKYFKAETVKDGDTITVTLPNAIESQKSSSIILYYRGAGYAKKNWAGAYSFTFETAKVNEKIRNLQVGINTDSDLVLKQAEGEVNYRLAADSMAVAKMEAAPAGVSNTQFDQIYQNIGYGSLVKSAQELQPLDSYTVTGEYAKSAWQLYANNILIAVVIALALIIIGVLGIRYALSRMKNTTTGRSALTGRDFIIAGSTGFGSAFLMLCYTILVMMIFYTFTYRPYNYYDIVPFLSIALMIVSSAVYMFLFITPAVVIGVKKGLWAGVITSVITIIWLFIFLAVALAGYLVLRTAGPGPGYPVPMMMRGGTMMDAVSEPSMQTAPASEQIMMKEDVMIAPDSGTSSSNPGQNATATPTPFSVDDPEVLDVRPMNQ